MLENLLRQFKNVDVLLDYCQDAAKIMYAKALKEEIDYNMKHLDLLIHQAERGDITTEMACLDMDYWTDDGLWKALPRLFEPSTYGEEAAANSLLEAIDGLLARLATLENSLKHVPGCGYERFHGLSTIQGAARAAKRNYEIWKEDFMISFTHTGAQDRAVQYAEEIIAQDPSKKYILCGQSKGGNLALYAACMINDESWEKVEHVYYLDGPGLCPEVTKLSKLDRIQDRTTCIGPEYAIIGKLFPVEIKDTRIVKSSLGGMMQHAMYSWGVDHGELATVPKNDPRSTWVNQVIDKWLTGISQEERKEFVNELFDALSNKGEIQTLDEIGSVDSVENVLVNMLTLSPRARKIAMELPRVAMLSQEAQKDVQDTIATVKKRGPIEWFTQSEVARGVVTILAGGIIAFLSQFIVNLLFILPLLVVSAGVVFFTVRRLYRSHWNFESERFAVTTSILLVVGLIVLLVKDQAIFLLGTMMFGILMMVFAYNMMSKIPSTSERFAKWIVIFETIFAAVFGLSFLIIPEHVVTVFALSIGVAMVVDGVVHVVHARWAKEEKKKISSASSQSKG